VVNIKRIEKKVVMGMFVQRIIKKASELKILYL